MKHKFIPLLCLFILLATLLTGCNKNNDINTANPTSTVSNNVVGGYNDIYTAELNDITEKLKNKNSFKTILPKDYELTATVNLSAEADADRMVYEIFIRKPKIFMSNLLMSYTLNPNMLGRLNTSDIFVTNGLNEKAIDYTPESETTGVSLFRGFVLDKTKLDKETLNIYKDLYIKISYTESGERVVDYIKMQAEPSQTIKAYITSNISN